MRATRRSQSLDRVLRALGRIDRRIGSTPSSWIDCGRLRGGDARGIFFAATTPARRAQAPTQRSRRVPFTPPVPLVNRLSVRAFNSLYYRVTPGRQRALDEALPALLLSARRAAGLEPHLRAARLLPVPVRRAPGECSEAASANCCRRSRHQATAPFSSVLKTFSARPAAGMLTFPWPARRSRSTSRTAARRRWRCCERLVAIVDAAGGRVYPAKDALMPPGAPAARVSGVATTSSHFRDPGISSQMSRRLRRPLKGVMPQRILVFGATSAIAHAVARRYAAAPRIDRARRAARRGARSQRQRSARARRSRRPHRRCSMLTTSPRHAEVIAAAFAAFGGFDTVLVARGVLPDQAASERSAEVAVASFDTNARSVIALLTGSPTVFESQGSGAIAVISSPAGDRGRASNYVYGAAKAAVTVFASGLRNRLSHEGRPRPDHRARLRRHADDRAFTKGPLWATAGTGRRRHRAGAGERLRRRLHAVVLALDHGDHSARSRADLRSNEVLTMACLRGSEAAGSGQPETLTGGVARNWSNRAARRLHGVRGGKLHCARGIAFAVS